MSRNWRLFGFLGREKAQDESTTTTPAVSNRAAVTTARATGLDDVRAAVDAFKKDPNARTAGNLRQRLWELVDFILLQPAEALSSLWTGALRPIREALKDSGLRAPARDARETKLAWSLLTLRVQTCCVGSTP